MPFLAEMDPATARLDVDALKQKGKEFHAQYQSAEPFPHIVIDDFLPRPIIDMCLTEFSDHGQDDASVYDRSQERLKREYKPDRMSDRPRNLFYTFNSRPFIQLIENITGIKGLIPDPYFMGGGFHEILSGGHLSIHADFNHHIPLNLERRINVLIYLNEDWQPAFGGGLEIWDNAMTHCVKSIVPILNRCVIFNTTSTSNHGNPQPINHPSGVSRKSIALYYYTATWSAEKRSHTTQFRVRRGSGDKPDWAVKRMELVDDFVPRIVMRAFARAKRIIARRP